MARKRPKMPPRLRKLVYERDGFTCRLCGWSPGVPEDYDGKYAIDVQLGTYEKLLGRNWVTGDRIYRTIPILKSLVVDHVHPYSRGGSFDDPANLQALCSDCNGRKGARV